MTLNAKAKIQNVKASVEVYIQQNIVPADITEVDWEGVDFESDGKLEWIEPRIIATIPGTFGRQTSDTTEGQEASVMLSINIYVDKTKTNLANRPQQIRDVLFEFLHVGSQIPLYDAFSGEFTTVLQNMRVREVVTDRVIPAEDNLSQYNYTVAFDWLQEW